MRSDPDTNSANKFTGTPSQKRTASPSNDDPKSNSTTADTTSLLSELAQAKIRNYLHCLLVILTLTAYYFDTSIYFAGIVATSVLSIVAALTLYIWALGIQQGHLSYRTRFYQRCASVVSDNLFISLVLHLAGESLAGVWALYIWISVGYGVRYGVAYLRVNVLVSVVAFTTVVVTTPFWFERPGFASGLVIAMALVPLYAGWLIKQLHAAVQEREIAYRAKSDFVARMSHELRTPLHAIISTNDLLKDTLDTQKQKDLANIVAVASSTLLDLINHVLDISKFESGAISLAKEPMNLHELISDTANIVLPQTKKKKLELRIFTDPAIDQEVLGAPQQLKEVFVNLLGNASKFTDEGHVALEAELIHEDPKEVHVEFRVTDSGPGIPPDDSARIFEPFTQADSSITRIHGGTGLGTSFAQELVRVMGGKISVDSTVGVGTVFTIRLTFDRQSADTAVARIYPLHLALISLSGGAAIINLTSKFGVRLSVYDSVDDVASRIYEGTSTGRIDGVLVHTDDFGENLHRISRTLANASETRFVPIAGYGDPSFKTAAMISGYCSFLGSAADRHHVARTLSTISSLASLGKDSVRRSTVNLEQPCLRILVAEDDPTNLKIARMILEEAGHLCKFVDNGDDALFELNDRRYDLAILDMHMPRRDGVEVAKIFNFGRFDISGSLPIILFTADTTPHAKAEARSAGITRFLSKPVRPSELLDAVTETHAQFHRGSPAISDNQSAENVEMAHVASEPAEQLNEESISDLLSYMTKEEQVQFFSEFADDAQEYIRALELAHSLSDVSKAQNDMHALAGAAVIIGAEKLAYLAKQIEHLEQRIVLERKLPLLSELKLCCDATLSEIRHRYT